MEYSREKHERKVSITGGLSDAYKLFISDKPHRKSIVNKQLYTNVCYDINKKISDAIIKDSLEVRLPFKLGFLRIKTFKYPIKFKDNKIDTQNNPINWNATKALWFKQYPGKTYDEIKAIPDKQIIIHVNEHTNGYIMKWYWDKRTCNIPNNSVYNFRIVKGGVIGDLHYGRKGLVEWLKSDERTNEYYE